METTRNPNDIIGTRRISHDYEMSRSTAWRLLNQPDAPTLQVGSNRRVIRSEFEQWLRTRDARGVSS